MYIEGYISIILFLQSLYKTLATTNNILFIMADQLRFDFISQEVSPNLMRLRSTGYNFVNAYSSTPTCTPARAAILTGRSPWYHGMLGYGKISKYYPQGEYPELLAALGYTLHAVGKNHFGWDDSIDEGYPMDSIQRKFTMVLEMAHEEEGSMTITMHGFRNINPVQILSKE